MKTIAIKTEFIKLDALLKFSGCARPAAKRKTPCRTAL